MDRERLERRRAEERSGKRGGEAAEVEAPSARHRLQRLVGNQGTRRLVEGREAASSYGPPGFVDPAEVGSPPATGPGSRGTPLAVGRGTLAVSSMRTDAFYASPVNPTNPVLVWTDGTSLFFSPSQGQIDSGRTLPAPEPIFAPPAGYVPEELRWDRRVGLVSPGPLLVISRKPGEADLETGVSNTLEQRAWFSSHGLAGSSSMHVSRENTEFLSSYDTSVPVELSGAAAAGPIHGVAFPDGFLRYRGAGGDHDLYVSRGAPLFAHLVERATGDLTESFPAGTLDTVVGETTGVVGLEVTRQAFGFDLPATVRIDLGTSPPTRSAGFGHASAEPGYDAARAGLEGLGVAIQEQGLRLRVAELETVRDMLDRGAGRGLDTLVRYRTLEGLAATDPILELTKRVGPDDARGDATPGMGAPTLSMSEPFDSPDVARVSTVRHEMTHVLMDATDALHRDSLTRRQRADLEGALRFEARRARDKARQGLLRGTEYFRGDAVPPAGTTADWRGPVGEDPELAAIWVELLRRYTFIADPEGTSELRGVSLADESRYAGVGEISVGHPADTVSEFAASFVASATVFRADFVAAVLAAETAGNARGGRGGSYLRGLYRQAWQRIDARYVPLGANPF